MLLIRGAEVYAPEYLGKKDVLLPEETSSGSPTIFRIMRAQRLSMGKERS